MTFRNLFIFIGIYSVGIVPLTAQNCQTLDVKDAKTEFSKIQGETVGQKLESLLFWSQQEREKRFPVMYKIFPSLKIQTGTSISNFEKSQTIVPIWEDRTTLSSYMKANHVKGVIVIKDNKIRLEKYAENVKSETLWPSFSVAKSVSSMLLGAALKDGHVQNMDDSLSKYIPEFEGYDYGKVTVRQLLTMTSGIDWNEDYEDPNSDVAKMYSAACEKNEPHVLTYMKSLKSAHEPGTYWNYSTGETDLVGILIQKATGKSLAAYLSEKIWKPFGMEHCAYWVTDECSNLNNGGSGLSASLRDYARIGAVMLNKGKSGNQNLFAEEWLQNATSPLYNINAQGDGYGYLWWRLKDGSYAAFGIFGQMLYVDPKNDLVIAQIAAWPKASSKDLARNRQHFIEAVQKAFKK